MWDYFGEVYNCSKVSSLHELCNAKMLLFFLCTSTQPVEDALLT